MTSSFHRANRFRILAHELSSEVDKKVDKNFSCATVNRSFAARAYLFAGDFKSDAYANSATRAGLGLPNQDCGMK